MFNDSDGPPLQKFLTMSNSANVKAGGIFPSRVGTSTAPKEIVGIWYTQPIFGTTARSCRILRVATHTFYPTSSVAGKLVSCILGSAIGKVTSCIEFKNKIRAKHDETRETHCKRDIIGRRKVRRRLIFSKYCSASWEFVPCSAGPFPRQLCNIPRG